MEEAISELDPFVVLALGFLMPPVTAILIRQNWSSETKSILGIFMGVAFGLAAAWWQDMWTREGVATTITAVWLLGQVFESRMFKPLGISTALENNITIGRSAGASQPTPQDNSPTIGG